MEVQREDLPLGGQQRCQGGDPAGEELLLVVPLGAVGVIGGVGVLGQDVEAREQAEGLIEVEIADVTARSLSSNFSASRLSKALMAGTICEPG